MAWAEEAVQITAGIGPYLDRLLNERKAYLYREQFPTRGDKGARAHSIRARKRAPDRVVHSGRDRFNFDLVINPTPQRHGVWTCLHLSGCAPRSNRAADHS
jgi:hypothetical protein